MIQFALVTISPLKQLVSILQVRFLRLAKHFSFKFLTNFFGGVEKNPFYPTAEVEMTKPLIILKILLLKVHICDQKVISTTVTNQQ